jgi:phosphotransferase system HPr (HPr) family protein
MAGRVSGNGPGPRDALPPGSRSPAPPQPPDTEPPSACAIPCPGGPLRRVVRVTNPNGLHPRLADRFLRTAKQYTCSVTVWNGELKADGRDIFALIMLLVFPGSDVVLEVDGPDAQHAMDPLAEVLGSPGGEDYTI